MARVSPDETMRENFGSVKAALKYCVDMNMNKAQSAKFLGVDIKVIRERASRFKITFPDGYKTRDMTLTIEVNRDRATVLNRKKLLGKARYMPIVHNGLE